MNQYINNGGEPLVDEDYTAHFSSILPTLLTQDTGEAPTPTGSGVPGMCPPSELPAPTLWAALQGRELAAHRERLRTFAAWRERVSGWSLGVLPPCWEQHPAMVEALSALLDSFDSEMNASQPAGAAMTYLANVRMVGEYLRSLTTESGCGKTHVEPSVQPWVHAACPTPYPPSHHSPC